MDAVPNSVRRIFEQQCCLDRQQAEFRLHQQSAVDRERKPGLDFMMPIVADAGAGSCTLTATMKQTCLLIENGASGIQINDLHPAESCAGKSNVAVNMSEFLRRIAAVRMQADMMKVPVVIFANICDTIYLENNSDPCDHPFILGATIPGKSGDPTADSLSFALGAGQISEAEWDKARGVMSYSDVIASILERDGKTSELKEWHDTVENTSIGIRDMRQLANKLGAGHPFFDWEAARSPESFFRVQSTVKRAIKRARAAAHVADAVLTDHTSWFQARDTALAEFAKGVLSNQPHLLLAHTENEHNRGEVEAWSDSQTKKLGELGYVWYVPPATTLQRNSNPSAAQDEWKKVDAFTRKKASLVSGRVVASSVRQRQKMPG